MKRILIILLLIIFCCCQLAYSGEKIVANTPTGDPVLDQSLEKLNEGVKANIGDFVKKLGRNYNIPEETAEWMLDRVGMSPGDAYMAAKVSKIANRPVEDVVEKYKANQGKGWGVIAKKLGIKPGSKEFHALKKDDSGMLDVTKGKKQKDKKSKGKKGKKTVLTEDDQPADKKGKGKKGKKTELTEDEQSTDDKGEVKSKKKGFFERWFGGGEKEKEKTKK